MRNNLFLLAILASIVSCQAKNNSKCSVDYTLVYNKDKDKLLIQRGLNENTVILRDKGVDSGKIGGVYEFYESGKLRQYRFFKSPENFTYEEYFNTYGDLIRTEDKPILTVNVDEINRDSIKFNFYVFSLKKNIRSFEIKVNNSGWSALRGSSDSIFANVVRFEHPLNARLFGSIKILERLKYEDCINSNLVALDSIFITRRNSE